MGTRRIEQFREHMPDITLMDLQMPKMNGLDTMLAIRGEFPQARIIILTPFAGEATFESTLQHRSSLHLTRSKRMS
jgi:DNA-binding NarL/FixJ family response regulator